MDDVGLIFNLGPNGVQVLLKGCFTEDKDVPTGLALELALVEVVVGTRKNNVANTGKEKPLTLATFAEEKTGSAFDRGRGSITNCDAERGGEWLTELYRVVVTGGLKKSWTSCLYDLRLSDFNINAIDALIPQKNLTPEGNIGASFV